MDSVTQKHRQPKYDSGLPAAEDSERLVFGAILSGTVTLAEVQRALVPDDFLSERHKRIFLRMTELYARGAGIDVVTVAEALKQNGQLTSVGPTYLNSLDGDLPRLLNVQTHIDIVREKSALRRIISHSHGLAQRALREEDSSMLTTSGADFFRTLQQNNGHHQPPAAPSIPQWPDPLQPEAMHGIAGDLVRLIEPHTESDPAALLVQFLVGWGSLAGRNAYYLAESDRHHTNEDVVIVATSGKGRKGTSWGRIGEVLGAVDERWHQQRQLSGLASGEALLHCFDEQTNDGEPKDHRGLVMESEFARLLAIASREGCTLSHNLRDAWDRGTLTIRRSQQKALIVRDVHLSMIGHITREELLRRLSDTEIANGFSNRILWVCARRSRSLPFGGGSYDISRLSRPLLAATLQTRSRGNKRMEFDGSARQLWAEIYPALSEGRPGLLGTLTNRGEAHVVRLSVIYALLDCSDVIGEVHLRAALAVWDYCFASARYIWGDALGDPTADEILRALRAAGNSGLTRWDLMNHFSRKKTATELDRALGVLMERGLIRSKDEATAGRSAIRYWAHA